MVKFSHTCTYLDGNSIKYIKKHFCIPGCLLTLLNIIIHHITVNSSTFFFLLNLHNVFKGSLTHPQALQISMKFLQQVASDIRIVYCESFRTQVQVIHLTYCNSTVHNTHTFLSPGYLWNSHLTQQCKDSICKVILTVSKLYLSISTKIHINHLR